MSRAQRLTFLAVAAAIAIVAVVVLSGGGEEAGGGNAAATPTATAAPQEASPRETATPDATPEPPPLLTAGKVTDIKVTEGETVRLRVRSATDEEVHVHGYDLLKDVSAGRTATMSFKATITGVFEIEFEHAHEQIARLIVEPR